MGVTFQKAAKCLRISHLLPRLAQGHVHVHLFLPAIDGDPHRVAGPMTVHDLAQGLLVLHRLAIDGDDQIAAKHDWNITHIGALVAPAQAGAFRRASGTTCSISTP